MEHIKELVHESIRNVQEDDPTLLGSGRVKLVGELPAMPGFLPWLCSSKSFQFVLMLRVVRTTKVFPACFPSVVGDGRQGYPEEAPYDAIHVGAAAATVPKEVRVAMLGVPRENAGTAGSFFSIMTFTARLIPVVCVGFVCLC